MKDIQIGDIMRINTKDKVLNISGKDQNGKTVLVVGLLKHLHMAEVKLLDGEEYKFYVDFNDLEECFPMPPKTFQLSMCEDILCQVSKFLSQLKSQGWDIKSFSIDMYKDGKRIEISHNDVVTK